MADTKLTAVIQLADKLSKPLKGINDRLQNSQKPIKGLSNQLGRLDRVSGLKNLRSSLGGVAGQLGKLGLIGAGGIGAMVAAVNKLSKSGDEVIKTATNFDISTDKLQEYRFIAERSGVSQGAVNKSMQAFTKRLAEARNGTGELFGLLKDVNPEFLKQLLAIEDNGEAYDLLIKKMAALPEQQRQILLGDKAFSEAGRELVKITSQGADAIEALRKEAHKYGAVIGEETLKKSAEFQDNMTNLGSIAKNLAFSFGQEMMPAIQGIVTSMTAWGAENKELIKTKLTEVAKKMADAIKRLGDNLPGIIDSVVKFVDSVGGMKTILIAAAAIITGPLISALATLSAVLLTTPIGWFVVAGAAIAGVAAMIMGKWNPIEKFFPNLWSGIIDTVGGSIDWLINIHKKLNPYVLIYKAWEPLTQFFTDIWDGIKAAFKSGWETIKPIIDTLSKAAETLTAPVKKLFEFGSNTAGAVSDFAGDAVGGVKSFFGGGERERQSILSGNQRTQVGGQVTVKIDSEGRPRVQQVRSDNPSVGLNVDAGMSLIGAM